MKDLIKKYTNRIESMMKDVPQKEGASIIVILRDGEHDLFGLRGRDVDISHSMFLAMKKNRGLERAVRAAIHFMDMGIEG